MPMSLPQIAHSDQDLVQETLLGEALEHAPVGAIVLDEQGRYLAANRMACELSGYSREELLGGGARALALDPGTVPMTMARMASGDLRGGTAQMRRKDGSAITCDYRVGATRSGGLPFFVIVFWEPVGSDPA
jgi:PAS domain S-box-containing protein